MQITKTRTYRVNLGNYEHIDVSATVVVGPDDVPPDTDVLSFINDTLNLLLEPELDAAAEMTANENSFVYISTPQAAAPTLQRSTLPRKRN